MDRENYTLEANRQLSNQIHYEKLTQPIFPSTAIQITEILDSLLSQKYIDDKQYDYLQPPSDPHYRKFYLLPKIHKKEANWTIPGIQPPGRPIISDCGTESCAIAEYIDHFLFPLSVTHSSYLKDTAHFLDTLKQTQVPEGALLITLDVDGLYTNINNNDGIRAVQQAFTHHPDPSRPSEALLKLLKLSLENNDFAFNGQWYLQKFGVAMGKKFAPNYANIFMSDWETGALAKCPLLPLLYKRFLDDIFLLWVHGREAFDKFFLILQHHHPSIKLKYEISPTEVNFLDTTVFKGPTHQSTGMLDTRVYFKETDSLQLLDKCSYHPKHTFSGIIKSQILRYKRICSNERDIDTACQKLFTALKTRGYSPRFLREIKNNTLHPKPPTHTGASTRCHGPRCSICPYITPETKLVTPLGPDDPPQLPIPSVQNCNSSNGIYFLKCKDCETGYVGETNNPFRTRLLQHLSDIRTRKDTVVARHFDPHDVICNMDSLEIILLETLVPHPSGNRFADKSRRLDKERDWSLKLRTGQESGGLNHIPHPTSNPILPFVVPYSETAKLLAEQARNTFDKIKAKFPKSFPHKFVVAYSRNQNIKDTLVKAAFGPKPSLPAPTECNAPPQDLPDTQEVLLTLAKLASTAEQLPP